MTGGEWMTGEGATRPEEPGEGLPAVSTEAAGPLLLHHTEVVEVASLHPHPRNYREHPADQLAHIEASLRANGVYRNVVVARDGTILAGHGVIEAAKRIGATEISVVRLDIGPDDPAALKIIPGDNEIGRMSVVDDRALAELLRDLQVLGDEDDPLLGTGFDEGMLVNMLMVTRPASEIGDRDAAAHWLGLPGFETGPSLVRLVLHFDNDADREALIEQLELVVSNKVRQTWAAWWPPRPADDSRSVLFDG